MKAIGFDANSPGHLVPQTLAEGQVAFIPNKLPPEDLEWTDEMSLLASKAEASMGRLAGTGEFLEEPKMIITPLRRREAFASNALEGTYVHDEKQAIILQEEYSSSNEARQIYNYYTALDIRTKNQNLPLTGKLIKLLHRTLLNDVRGENKNPGNFRRLPAGIGGSLQSPRFSPTPAQNLQDCVSDLEIFMNEDIEKGDHSPSSNPLIRSLLVHYQFESIHPFGDGNGRVGRLLMSLMTQELRGDSFCWLMPSPYFEEHKDEYIDRLYGVSARGEWAEWVLFGLTAIQVECDNAWDRARQLIQIQREFRDQIAEFSDACMEKIIRMLFSATTFSLKQASESLGVVRQTAAKKLNTLEKMEIVRSFTHSRQKYFYSPKVWNLVRT